jgi:outer membrane protein TolC
LNNAQVAYTQALTDYKNAQANIEKAIGKRMTKVKELSIVLELWFS